MAQTGFLDARDSLRDYLYVESGNVGIFPKSSKTVEQDIEMEF